MLATLFLIASLVFGQPEPPFGEEKKYEGAVVLASEKVITGTFYFDEKKDFLYRKSGDVLEVFSLYRLKSFHFYDAEQNFNRQFMKWPANQADFPYQLYEIVVPGEVKVLRKRKKYEGSVGNESGSILDHHSANYHYFILYQNQLLDIRQFAGLVYPGLKEKENTGLEQLHRESELNIHHPASAIKLIKEYNRLRKAQPNPLLF